MLESTSNQTEPSTFIRVGSIDLSGTVRLRIHSKPLEESICPDCVLDLDMLDELNLLIKTSSLAAKGNSGRRGCTTEELYKIIQTYFLEKVKLLVRDLAMNKMESMTVREATKMATNTRDSFTQYALKVKGKAEENIENMAFARLKKWGQLIEEFGIDDVATSFVSGYDETEKNS